MTVHGGLFCASLIQLDLVKQDCAEAAVNKGTEYIPEKLLSVASTHRASEVIQVSDEGDVHAASDLFSADEPSTFAELAPPRP